MWEPIGWTTTRLSDTLRRVSHRWQQAAQQQHSQNNSLLALKQHKRTISEPKQGQQRTCHSISSFNVPGAPDRWMAPRLLLTFINSTIVFGAMIATSPCLLSSGHAHVACSGMPAPYTKGNQLASGHTRQLMAPTMHQHQPHNVPSEPELTSNLAKAEMKMCYNG